LGRSGGGGGGGGGGGAASLGSSVRAAAVATGAPDTSCSILCHFALLFLLPEVNFHREGPALWKTGVAAVGMDGLWDVQRGKERRACWRGDESRLRALSP
jgi:hypothetical protein